MIMFDRLLGSANSTKRFPKAVMSVGEIWPQADRLLELRYGPLHVSRSGQRDPKAVMGLSEFGPQFKGALDVLHSLRETTQLRQRAADVVEEYGIIVLQCYRCPKLFDRFRQA